MSDDFQRFPAKVPRPNQLAATEGKDEYGPVAITEATLLGP